jgi:hypothetical protein
MIFFDFLKILDDSGIVFDTNFCGQYRELTLDKPLLP